MRYSREKFGVWLQSPHTIPRRSEHLREPKSKLLGWLMRRGKATEGYLQQTRLFSVLVQHLFVRHHERPTDASGAVSSEQLGP